ncbi:MAG: hypothetical protein V7640_2937 [Betaproteobacteria bacterium]
MSKVSKRMIIEVKAVARGYRTGKLKVTNVTHDQNEKLGNNRVRECARDNFLT